MAKEYRQRLSRTIREAPAEKQRRDAYDWLMFSVQLVGTIVVVAALVASIANNRESGREMANAMGSMETIANSMVAQQRPILTLDLNAAENDIKVLPGGIVAWKYSFKNVGMGSAFNVIYDESLSLNGAPFQQLRRIGSKLSPPGDLHFSGAAYVLRPNELVAGQRSTLTLRVRFEYSDTGGRRYIDTSCVIYTEGAPIRDCSFNADVLAN